MNVQPVFVLLLVASLLYFVAVAVGMVSAVIHDRDPPESLRDRAFWLSRGIAYLTLAAGALWVLGADPMVTIILLGVFFLGVVGWRMRRRGSE